MKKYLQQLFILSLIVALSGCAPKVNQNKDQSQIPSESTPSNGRYETFTLYFPNETELILEKESHEFIISKDSTQEKLILDALKMGPKDNNLSPPLSSEAKILSIKTLSGLCTIDFSENFLNTGNNDTNTANLMLHSIVNSLCELETIQEVKINVDGNTKAKINEEIDLSQPISADIAKI